MFAAPNIRPYHRYREEILRGISDEQIMHKICEGTGRVAVLQRFHGQPDQLRAWISKCLGEVEREHAIFVPEWAAPCQTLLVSTFACTIELMLFGRVQKRPEHITRR